MNRATSIPTVTSIVLFLVSAVATVADDFDIDWHTVDGGGEMFSTGGDFALGGTIGQPDAGQMAGGIYTLTGGFWFGQVSGECNVTAVRSYRDHEAAGRLGLDMGVSGGVEPRLGGIVELEIDLDDAAGAGTSATVTCSAAWAGSADVTVNGNTATVTFDPALPDEAYCVIELQCGAQVCVRGLAGDIDRSGLVVSTGDASIIKPHFGETANANNAQYDFDCSGLISTGDFSQVKPKFGNTVPPCPPPPPPPPRSDADDNEVRDEGHDT